MTATDLIEAARARHSEAEMDFRRRALVARILGRDPELEMDAIEAHHRAFVACSREIDAMTVRKVG